MNGNYGKVTTAVNPSGRYGVKPFTELVGPLDTMFPVPMGTLADVLLKAENITVLPPNNKQAEHMRSYSASLHQKCMGVGWQERCFFGPGTPE